MTNRNNIFMYATASAICVHFSIFFAGGWGRFGTNVRLYKHLNKCLFRFTDL